MPFELAPAQQVAIYLAQFLVIATGWGCLTLHLPRMLPIPRSARFLSGFTLAPYTIGAIMAILGALLPGAPAWLFYWLPSIMAVILLAAYGPRSVHRLLRSTQRQWRNSSSQWLNMLLAVLAASVVLLGVGPRLWNNGWLPITGHDALLYSSKAATFAEERATNAISGLRGDSEGTTREDSHGVLYPAFLGHAMLTVWGEKAGTNNDFALRFAFQVNFLLMLLAMVALGSTYRLAGAGALAVVLILMVGRFEYISYQSSRDAYRIIPLLLFSTLLTGLAPRRMRSQMHPSVVLPLVLLPVAALYGHTLGGILVVISTGVWAICVAGQRAPLRRVLLVLLAIGVGLTLGSMRYFDLYLTDHIIQGYASVEGTLKGTVLAPVLQASRSEIAQTGLVERLRLPFAIDNFYLSLPGVLAAVGSLVWWQRNRQSKHSFVFLLMGLTMLGIFLPLTGLLDYSGYRISRSFVRNERYTLHWYPYAAVCVAGLVLAIHQWAVQQATKGRQPRNVWLAHAGLTVLVLAGTITAYSEINREWRTRTVAQENRFTELTAPIRVMQEHLPDGQRWLLDDDRYNYRLGNNGLVMYTRTTWPVVRALDEQSARQALDDLQIDAVALLRNDIPDWWEELPFFAVLNAPQEALVLSGSSYLVFDRVSSPADYGRHVASYLAAAEQGGPSSFFAPVQALPPELGEAAGPIAVLTLAHDVDLVLPDADYAVHALESAVTQTPGDAPLHQALGHVYSVLHNPSAAMVQYKQALAAGGEATNIHPFMAAAYLQQAEQLAAAGDTQAALASVEAALPLARGERWFSEQLLAAYRGWASSHFDVTLQAVIAEPLEAAANAVDASAADYVALAKMYQQFGNVQTAEQLYSIVLERWPENDDALDALTARPVVRANWQLAARAYQQKIRNNPADSDAYRRLADLLLDHTQLDRAAALYLAAAAANPEAGWPQLELGKLYQRQARQQP